MIGIKLPTSPRFANITGNRYGRWLVIGFSHITDTKRTLWLCQCDCGTKRIVEGENLKNGNTKSCGCSRELRKTYGMEKTAEYQAWKGLKKRCKNPTAKGYKNYGGRGITVCERWINSFESFFEDMGLKPSPELSIDRTNNELGYFKENCRWATAKEQANNRRNNIIQTERM